MNVLLHLMVLVMEVIAGVVIGILFTAFFVA